MGVPRFGNNIASNLGGTDKNTIMASSWIDFRSLGLETILCIVPFLDHTQPTIESESGSYGFQRTSGLLI